MHNFFVSKPPEVKLVGLIQNPYDLSVATARTCYSAKGIITPEQVSKDEKSRALRDRIAASTREAGHLTTRQHAHFVFSMDHVSRQFLWEFLHSHPFYNSEQVSQRYVKVKKGSVTIPLLKGKAQQIYEEVIQSEVEAYETLIDLLMPASAAEYYRLFPNRKKNEVRWNKTVKKKVFEIARYVLPVATQAYLYHTVSALTLMRYHKMSQSSQASSEQQFIIRRMVEEVLKVDPDFKQELDAAEAESQSANEEPLSPSFSQAKAFIQTFDAKLQGKYSLLIDSNRHPEKTLADAVRLVKGGLETQLSDEAAIRAVLDPASNKELGHTFNLTTLSPLSRALFHVHFTFIKKLSHTADSQNQRHRMTPATRPPLERHYSGEPDVIIPKLMKEVPQAARLYNETVAQCVEGVNALLTLGVSFEQAQYLLPNGWAVRFEESGDLLNWHHKWKLRTCYNAQEEIFYASVDELRQVNSESPLIGQHILAPCYLRKRANITPYCPEGDRYCGVAVWNQSIEKYSRLI